MAFKQCLQITCSQYLGRKLDHGGGGGGDAPDRPGTAADAAKRGPLAGDAGAGGGCRGDGDGGGDASAPSSCTNLALSPGVDSFLRFRALVSGGVVGGRLPFASSAVTAAAGGPEGAGPSAPSAAVTALARVDMGEIARAAAWA